MRRSAQSLHGGLEMVAKQPDDLRSRPGRDIECQLELLLAQSEVTTVMNEYAPTPKPFGYLCIGVATVR